MVDRQTEGAEISLKGTQRHDGQCTTKTLDQGQVRDTQRIKKKRMQRDSDGVQGRIFEFLLSCTDMFICGFNLTVSFSPPVSIT